MVKPTLLAEFLKMNDAATASVYTDVKDAPKDTLKIDREMKNSITIARTIINKSSVFNAWPTSRRLRLRKRRSYREIDQDNC